MEYCECTIVQILYYKAETLKVVAVSSDIWEEKNVANLPQLFLSVNILLKLWQQTQKIKYKICTKPFICWLK